MRKVFSETFEAKILADPRGGCFGVSDEDFEKIKGRKPHHWERSVAHNSCVIYANDLIGQLKNKKFLVQIVMIEMEEEDENVDGKPENDVPSAPAR